MAAAAAAQILAGGPNGLADRLKAIDWPTMGVSNHQVTRRPHCAVCGTPASMEPRPVELRGGIAPFTSDGGHRVVSPEKTLQAYEHLISPITGVVRGLAPIDPAAEVAHVFVAGHNYAQRMETLGDLKRNLRSASAGKGVTAAQAKTSALCESIERYSGECVGEEIRVRRAWRDWAPGEAIHPNAVMNFSARQYAEREARNARSSRFNVIAEPLPDDKPIDWTPVWSLTERRHKYLPTQLVYFAAGATPDDRTMHALGCSNGNASGNTLEEAVLQGFFELAERDAIAVWWYNRLRRPGVASDTFGEPYIARLTDHLRKTRGRESWALDLTNDLGVPVFVALSRLADGPKDKLLLGFGAHLDPRLALQRAYAEMIQMLGNCDDAERPIEDPDTVAWMETATLENQPHLAPDPASQAVRHGDFPVQHSGDLLVDIERCRAIVEGLGMEVLVLDQTRAEIGMSVVKVVVPGLRHFWGRYAPGRLYDVPVKLGWLPKPLAEDELNPIPMFI